MLSEKNIKYAIENYDKHKPVMLSKYSFKFLKKDIKFCAYCQEEWPCRAFSSSADTIRDVLGEFHNEWEYHTRVTTTARLEQIELLRRIRVAQLILAGKTPEELKVDKDGNVHMSTPPTTE